MGLRKEWKRTLGLAILSSSVCLYLLYQSTEYFFAGISCISLFAIGAYLSIKDTKPLKPLERILPFLVFGAASSLVIATFDVSAILDSSDYARALAFTASRLTGLLLSAGGVRVVISNDVLLFSNGRALSVGPLCSGAYSTVLFLLLTLVMVADLGRRAPKGRMVIALALGVVGVNLANVLRITFLASVMYLFGIDTLAVVHQFAGYAWFLGFMSAFWLLSLRWLGPKGGQSGGQVG